jgi:outer membrane protein
MTMRLFLFLFSLLVSLAHADEFLDPAVALVNPDTRHTWQADYQIAAPALATCSVNLANVTGALDRQNLAVDALKAEADRKQKELLSKQDELKKLEEDFLKQQSVLQPAAAQKKREELQQKVMQLQEALQRAQQDIGQKEAKVLQPLQEKVVRAIDGLARRDNFAMVLRSDVVLWPQQSPMDITNEVIRKVNDMRAAPTGGSGVPAGGGR